MKIFSSRRGTSALNLDVNLSLRLLFQVVVGHLAHILLRYLDAVHLIVFDDSATVQKFDPVALALCVEVQDFDGASILVWGLDESHHSAQRMRL